MGISDRLYNLAKSYLDTAKTRWDEVDPAAQKELDDAVSSPGQAAWQRAQAKINAAQTQTDPVNGVHRTLPRPVPTPVQQFEQQQQPVASPGAAAGAVPLQQAQQPSENVLSAAYKVLNLPPGSDLSAVQKAYRVLENRADPSRFPEGSKDRKLAQDILRRINGAYMLLANTLSGAADDRFDRLEL
jgi:DnaJ-domain-containing protein 1